MSVIAGTAQRSGGLKPEPLFCELHHVGQHVRADPKLAQQGGLRRACRA